MYRKDLSTHALKVDYTDTKRADMEQMEEINLRRQEEKRMKKQGLDYIYNQDYQPAKYSKAQTYKNIRSYKTKISNGKFSQLSLFEDTQKLKTFGLGPYFYIEFMRRVTWLLLFLMFLDGIRIYLNYNGSKISQFNSPLYHYFVIATVGNFSGQVFSNKDIYLEVVLPGVSFLTIFIFFIIWKAHYFKEIQKMEQDNNVVRPGKFCVQVQGFNQKSTTEDDLQRFFSTFGPIYEVSFVRKYKNKLTYFEELDQLQQEIKQEQLELILGSGDQDHINTLKQEKQQINKYINTFKIKPSIISAYIHFQFEKSKIDMVTLYNDKYLFDTCTHSCFRDCCCCCVDELESKYRYQGKQLKIKNVDVPQPEDINWQSIEIGLLSKFCRVFLAFFIICVFLILSCTVIGLCSLYISSNSQDCLGIAIPSSVSQTEKQADQENYKVIKTCFCLDNMLSSITNNDIQSFCGDLLYISQIIQLVIILSSGLINFLFGLIVNKLVDFTRPASFSQGLHTKTIIFTFFVILNTCFLPILLYANIFEFKAARHVSLLTLISTDLRELFQVQKLDFYPDFEENWFRNVSPIFINYVIGDAIITLLYFIFCKCTSDKESLKSQENIILQKNMNLKMTSFKLNIYVQYTYFNLILFMTIFFFTGIPLILPFGFLNLWLKYVCNRSLLQSNSTRIEGLTQAFNSMQLAIIPITLIIAPLFGAWMLTANSIIYPSGINIKIAIPNSFYQLQRQLYLPYFLILSTIVLIYFFLWNTIFRFFSWLSSLCYNKKRAVVHPYHTRPFSQYAKQMNTTPSYNIRNNDNFRNIIINLEKYLIDEDNEKIPL